MKNKMEKQNQFSSVRLFLAGLFFMCLPFANVAMADDIASGYSGGCTWTISADSVLTIKPTNGNSGTLEDWGTLIKNIPWYQNRTKVKKVVVESGVTTSTCINMFNGMSNCTEMDLSGLSTAEVTRFTYMFLNCKNLKTIKFGDGWDTSNGTNFMSMFLNCSSLTAIDVSKFNTSSAENIGFMFVNCSSLKTLDLSSFNTSNVKHFDAMFQNCTSLTSLNLGKFQTSSGTTFNNMFTDCSSLTKLDLSSFEINAFEPEATTGGKIIAYQDTITKGMTSLDTLITPKTINDTITLKTAYPMRDWTKGEIIAAGGKIPAGCHLLTRSYKPRTVLQAELEGADQTKVSGYWGTMYTDMPVSVPEGVTVYYAIPYEKELKTVAFVEVSSDKVLPAGGYLLRNTASVDQNKFTFQEEATVEIPEENVLKGATTQISDDEEGYYYYYLTTYQGSDPGFYWKVKGGRSITMSAYKCYLKVPEKYIDGEEEETTGSGTRNFSYTFLNHDELTGIDQVTGHRSQVTNAIYDLQGRKVQTMQRGGLYIKNGKVILNR